MESAAHPEKEHGRGLDRGEQLDELELAPLLVRERVGPGGTRRSRRTIDGRVTGIGRARENRALDLLYVGSLAVLVVIFGIAAVRPLT